MSSFEGSRQAGVAARTGIDWRKRVDLLIAAGVVLVVAAPLLFTGSGFGIDFTNHLWLSWAEGKGLAQAGHPDYFVNARGVGVFYPFFAFYGGSLYAIVGALSDLLGDQPVVAYVGVTVLAIAGSYGGVVWLARQLGLRGRAVHAPALVVVTSAYYITNLYGRGAWPEFMAVAAIAPLLASSVYLIRTPVWQPWSVLVFVLSTVVFSGSHNITLLWGTTVTVFAFAVLWLALGAPRRLPLHRLAMVGGLGLASAAVNGWFLVPDIVYAKDTIAHLYVSPSGALATFFDSPWVLLDPLRTVPARSTTPALFVQAPVWFLAWALLIGPILIWRRDCDVRLRQAWIGVVLIIGALLAMIMVTPVWSLVGFPFDEIQFPYRLNSYVFYFVGGLVLVGSLVLQQAAGSGLASRAVAPLRWALVLVCSISIGLCVWQLWVPNTLFPKFSYPSRQEALASIHALPRTWYDDYAYRDVAAPVVAVPAGRSLIIPPSSVHGDHFAALLEVPPGPEPIQTNISAGSYLVHISGLRRIGRSELGQTVVRRETDSEGPVHVVLEVTHSATIVLGWLMSILGCAVVGAVLVWTAIRSRMRRRAGPR